MKKGFTLVEILVVIAISAMLATIALGYSRTAQNQIALSVETAKIAQTILRAKDLTLATYANVPGTCGYGVIFDSANSNYSLFAYTPGGAPPCPGAPAAFPSPCGSTCSQISPGTWQTPLANAVRMSSQPDSATVIIFYPPAPQTFISRDGGATFANATSKVYLNTIDGSASTTVSINPGGQITF